MDRRRRLADLFALGCLAATSSHLAARYNDSISFARPIHFTVSSLLAAAASCFVLARLSSSPPPADALCTTLQGTAASAPPTHNSSRSRPWVRFRNLPGARLLDAVASHALVAQIGRCIRRIIFPSTHVQLLAFMLGCRAVLSWHVMRHIQCSWSSVHLFLPFFVCLADLALPFSRSSLVLPRAKEDPGSDRIMPRTSITGRAGSHRLARHAVLALVWGVAAAQTASSLEKVSGTICPRGWRLGPTVPAAQLAGLALDAAVMARVSRIRAESTASPTARGPSLPPRWASGTCWATLANVCFLSAAVLGSYAALLFSVSRDIMRPSDLACSDVPGLALDSAAAAALFVSAVHILGSLHPATVALVVVGLGSYVHHLVSLPGVGGLGHAAWATSPILPTAVLVCTGLLVGWDKDIYPSSRSSASAGVTHKALGAGYATLVVFVLASLASSQLSRQPVLRDLAPLSTVISEATAQSKRWQERAAGSRTLEEAIRAYRQRHGIPPPPNFDKWYEFARFKNSSIIDEFAQISSDLLPFWGLKPSAIRNQTARLMEDPSASIGGLRVQNGEIKLSPHTPDTHRWMMEGIANMIQPFAQWLPDMDLAFNLDDECRVAVPYEEQASLKDAALKAHARLRAIGGDQLISAFELHGTPSSSSPSWSDKPFTSGSASQSASQPLFVRHDMTPIYREFVAPTCPPGSLARTSRWWNRKELCTRCVAPHTMLTLEGSVVSNWTKAGDVCQQPDLAYMDGFLLSPAAMRISKVQLPIFSQAKVEGFADILIPSPWNFMGKAPYDDDDEAADAPWAQKLNTIFWRGSATDGFAVDGAWQSFLRARFVDAADAMAAQLGAEGAASAAAQAPFGVNVSFVGEFPRCWDCQTEVDHFYVYARWPADAAATSHQQPGQIEAASVPFVEHWRYRHLVDLDGAGFSGRFLPFLESRSLVYRAAVFRTWFDERVHPWRHFVPLDLRLGEWLWNVVRFFSSSKGSPLGEQIALEGREWARKALRPADMEVYMFRLLLEWGRLIDDRREEMGYSMAHRPAST